MPTSPAHTKAPGSPELPPQLYDTSFPLPPTGLSPRSTFQSLSARNTVHGAKSQMAAPNTAYIPQYFRHAARKNVILLRNKTNFLSNPCPLSPTFPAIPDKTPDFYLGQVNALPINCLFLLKFVCSAGRGGDIHGRDGATNTLFSHEFFQR